MEEFYRERGSAARVDLCPLANQSLVDLLGRRGFRIVHFDNIWALPLPGWRQRADSPPGIEVRECSTEEEDTWVKTVARGFAEEVRTPDFKIDRPYFHVKGFACFLALIDGLPVAGASIFVHEGVPAMMFADSTLAEYRRKGVQTAVIGARLDYAHGGRVATWPQSKPIPARLHSAISNELDSNWPIPRWSWQRTALLSRTRCYYSFTPCPPLL